MTAMVSPKALEMASTTPAKIPALDFLNTTFRVVSHFVAPRDNDASRKSCGVLSIISKKILIINGKIITANTIPPANNEYPVEKSTKCGARVSKIKGTRVRVPQTP